MSSVARAGDTVGDDWRKAAEARIAEHRTGLLTVAVRRHDGEPLEGASVRVKMERHSFIFGLGGVDPTQLAGIRRLRTLPTSWNGTDWPRKRRPARSCI